jgi:hypothetical protein
MTPSCETRLRNQSAIRNWYQHDKLEIQSIILLAQFRAHKYCRVLSNYINSFSECWCNKRVKMKTFANNKKKHYLLQPINDITTAAQTSISYTGRLVDRSIDTVLRAFSLCDDLHSIRCIQCPLCRLIRCPEHLIGRHWYLPANWRSFIRWSPDLWISVTPSSVTETSIVFSSVS